MELIFISTVVSFSQMFIFYMVTALGIYHLRYSRDMQESTCCSVGVLCANPCVVLCVLL